MRGLGFTALGLEYGRVQDDLWSHRSTEFLMPQSSTTAGESLTAYEVHVIPCLN